MQCQPDDWSRILAPHPPIKRIDCERTHPPRDASFNGWTRQDDFQVSIEPYGFMIYESLKCKAHDREPGWTCFHFTDDRTSLGQVIFTLLLRMLMFFPV